MSWLKPMLLMIVLGGIAYGVYVVLNKGPAPEPPPGVSKDWARPVDIQGGTPSNNPGSVTLVPQGTGSGAPPPLSAAPPFGSSPAMPAAGSLPPAPEAPAYSGNPAANPFPRTSSSAGSNPLPSTMASPTLINPADAHGAPSSSAASVNTTNASMRGAVATDLPPIRSASDVGAAASHGGGAASTATASDHSAAAAPNISYSAAMEFVQPLLNDGKLADALRLLTHWYGNPQLTANDAAKIDDLLGRLAGTVIYSRKHLLLPPYVVQSGDRLQTVADQYKIPWQLLAKINGIENPEKLVPGEKLKVIRGPFMAWVDPDKKELTLFVQECYAGRFRLVSVGREAGQTTGMFDVKEKQLDPSGRIPAEAATAAQLAVHHCVNFGDKLSIRGVNGPLAGDDPRGLSLESRDAEDVFDILTVGSKVMIRR